MFGLFKKKVKTGRRYDVTHVQSELVVLSSRFVSKQTDLFYVTKDKKFSAIEDSTLLSADYITPWVIGYLTGILDAVTQTQANRMTFTPEMLELLFAVVFGDDKSSQATVTYIASNEVSSPNDPLYGIYESYMSGLSKAFNEICEDKPVVGLFNYLIQD